MHLFVYVCLPYFTMVSLSIDVLSCWSSYLQCLLYWVPYSKALEHVLNWNRKTISGNTSYLIYTRPSFYIWPLDLSQNLLICQMWTIPSHQASLFTFSSMFSLLCLLLFHSCLLKWVPIFFLSTFHAPHI